MVFGRGKGGWPPGKAAAMYQAGISAFDRGQYAEAIELLSSIADQRDLPGTLARFYLGQSHLQYGLNELRLGRYAPAARHLTAARQINPSAAELSRYLVICHAGRGRFDQAATELEKARDDGLRDADLPIRLAHAFARDGQRERALETLQKAIDESPRRADLRLQLGLLHAAVDEFGPAVSALTEAARLAPADAAVHRHLGLALGARGDAAGAVRHLSIAQKLRPSDASVSLLLALAADAAQTAGQEIAVEPALCGTGILPVQEDTGETPVPHGSAGASPSPARTTVVAEAPDIEELSQLVAEDPEFVEAFLSLPLSEVDPEIFLMLASVLERVLARHPEYADLHYHCSRVYDRLGRTDSAVEAAARAVKLNPRYVQALIQLGRLHAETDRTAEAMDRLHAAIRSGGDYSDVHFLLGELYRRDGRLDQARASYRRALELNAQYDRAQHALEAIGAA